MAKPFTAPETGPDEASSSSGAGPPANAATNTNTAPSTPAPTGPIVVVPNPAPGPPGHVPSAPIRVTGGNAQQPYHLQQWPVHQQQLQQHYPPYSGSHGHPVAVGGNPGVDAHAMVLPMTPPASGFATAVQTPQMAPVNEQLVQALYEAICRCTIADGPPTPLSQSPPSASCSPFTTGGFYSPPGQVFFPRTPASTTGNRAGGRMFTHQPQNPQHLAGLQPQPTPVSANSHSSSSGVSSSLDTPSWSSGTPHFLQTPMREFLPRDDGDSSESEGSSSQGTSSSGCSPHCLRSSDVGVGGTYGSPSTATLISPSSSGGTLYAAVPPHLDYMAGREQLQEFPGKIPQRKRKPRTPKAKKETVLDQSLMWQMAVTAALIVLGCGYFASR